MLNQLLLPDSANLIKQTIEIAAPVQSVSLLDTFCKIATVFIASLNVSLVIYIFAKNSQRDTSHKDKERKINLLKTLVLDYSMPYFYQFFNEIDIEIQKLKYEGLDNVVKKSVNESLLLSGKNLEHKFIDLFLGIDLNLYKQIKIKIDSLLDGFTESIFNEEINLHTEVIFDDFISNNITNTRSQIIRILFNYSGN